MFIVRLPWKGFYLSLGKILPMILVGNVVLSDDIKENFFVCDLEACKGACCVEGDSGAPLDDEETKILEEIYPLVKDYITEEGRQVIESQGTWIIDSDGDKVTPTLGANGECAYSLYDARGIPPRNRHNQELQPFSYILRLSTSYRRAS